MTCAVELGRYRVLRPLGRGGMAEVLEAVAVGAEGFERRVAIKRLLPGQEHDPDLVGMFLDEARIASRLHHANIVSVLDFGVLDEQPFQVLELVDGRDAAFVHERGRARERPLPLSLVLHIGTTIAHALHHAHTACDSDGEPMGIVHRDVSPANILISWEGDILLADFGIALAKHRTERTRTGVAKGTATYWAPEQATGGQVDGRTDVFALGATVHRLATGQSPLAGENALADLLIGRPVPLDPSLPDDVAEVLAKALQRDKALRYPDAAAFAGALGTCMSRRLQEDPRSALRRWLASVRDEPAAARPAAGALDALLGLEWVVVGDSEGVRTFAAHPVTPTPGGTVVVGGTAVATTEVMAGGTASGATGTSGSSEASAEPAPVPHASAGPESRQGMGMVAIAVAVALGGLAFGVWSWFASRAESGGVVASDSSPSAEVVRGGVSSSSATVGTGTGADPTGATESAEGATDSTGLARDEAAGGSTTSPRPDVGTDRSARTSPGRGRRPNRKTPPPDAAGTGYLLIGGAGALRAEIVVDGRRHGHAPRKIELSAGRHHVVLRDGAGAVVAERDVELRASHTRSTPFRWVVAG